MSEYFITVYNSHYDIFCMQLLESKQNFSTIPTKLILTQEKNEIHRIHVDETAVILLLVMYLINQYKRII